VDVPVEAVRNEAAELFGSGIGPTWDIDVTSYTSHERVLYYMDYFTRRARRHFEIYLARLGRYDSMVRTRLAAAGLPQDLIYLAMIESGMNHLARSRVGATGLWQFMPATARRYGLAVDAWVDERRDPWLSTDAAIRFLQELNDRFGSLYLAAAAYNSGPGKIQRGLARFDFGELEGDQVYFALSDGTTFLRRETRDYVPKLIAAALLAKEPERYGFEGIRLWAPIAWDSVEVRYAVGLDVLARLSGSSRDAMEVLNPSYYRGVTPPDRTVWVRVPVGRADSVAARLAVLPARDRVTVVVHFVTRGETLGRIGQRYGVSVSDIVSANRGVEPRRLRPGQRLVIPTSLSRRSGASAAPAAASRRVHIVRRGETLFGIAQSFGVDLDRLLGANGLTERSVILPGQAIRIPN
jgi:membrane-bound lytic murein transglycosylase D